MKKNIFVLALISGLCTSFTATAVEIESGTPITTTDCSLLGEQVTLNLSNNVSGAYTCDETNSIIKVAACHKAGSRKPTDVLCAVVTPANGTDPAVYNDSSCQSVGPDQKFEITDYRGYVASSLGGSVAPQQLGGNCETTSIDALVN
ncbi:MAG: hypothetical protein OZ926_07025 [Pseudomonas sp.]|nr:hypothetical protein [Stutzerimonas stutzeri]MEB2326586.1 hypothetical protein [Pseudomonas sp.]